MNNLLNIYMIYMKKALLIFSFMNAFLFSAILGGITLGMATGPV
jgi:hypothetical protein